MKQEIYNVLLKVSLYFFILFLLLFVVDLLFAVTDNAIDCSTGAFCSIKPGYNFYEITLMILGGLIVVFMILARVFNYLVKRYDDLIDVNQYKEKYQQSQQAFSESELYQSTKIEKEDSIASILLKSVPEDDAHVEHEKEITIDDLEELPDLEDEELVDETDKIVVEDLMAEEIEIYKKQKEDYRQAEILARQKALEEERQKELDKLSKEIDQPAQFEEDDEISIEDLEDETETSLVEEKLVEEYDEDQEISTEHLIEDSAIDQLAIKDIKERLYKDAIIVTEEEIKEKLKDQSKADVIEELRAEKLIEKEQAKQAKLKAEKELEEIEASIDEETEESTEELIEESIEEEIEEPKPKVAKPKKKATSKSKKDLIEDIAEASGLSKNKSEQFLNTMIDVITGTLNGDAEVDFGAIGKFSYIIMPAKDAVNPQTKEKIVVPAHKEVRFRFDEDFKNAVNQE